MANTLIVPKEDYQKTSGLQSLSRSIISIGNPLTLAREGLHFLRRNPLVLNMILFMSGVNLIASAFDAALPGLVMLLLGAAGIMLCLLSGQRLKRYQYTDEA